MNTISMRFSAVVAFGLAAAVWAGCEFITAVDRTDIPTGGAGGAGGGSTQTGGGNSQGGGGSMNQGGGGSNQGGGGAAPAEVLLISEVRTRGENGAGDEFIELYNPTSAAITTDSSWRLEVRSSSGNGCPNNNYVNVWGGAGESVPSHGHLLIASATYVGPSTPDAELMNGPSSMPDAASIVLYFNNNPVDRLCFYYDQDALDNMTTNNCNPAYVCEGMPVQNPHNDNNPTNDDISLERRPGGTDGNGTDSDDNANDFVELGPPTDPQSSSSPPTP